MRDALRAAADDAGAPALLAQADSICVTQGFHDYGNPAAWLAEQLGAPRPDTVYARIRASVVQQMLDHACAETLAGRSIVKLLPGGESEQIAQPIRRTG